MPVHPAYVPKKVAVGLWLLIPEETRNICVNPSLEVDVQNWDVAGAGITFGRVLTRSRFGRACGQAITPGTVASEAVRYTHPLTVPALSPITGSVYVRGQGRVFARLRCNTNNVDWNSEPLTLSDDYWQRMIVSGTIGPLEEAADGVTLAVRTLYNQKATIYVDGCQLELKGHATTYCDGDQELELGPHDGGPYFEWVGQRHSTASFRSRTYRMGGRWETLTEGLDTQLYPIESSGLGMPPLVLGTQVYSGQERALVQSIKAQARSIGLNFYARRQHEWDECFPESLKELHNARAALEAVVKPDVRAKVQSLLLRYDDGPVPMDLEAIYESGLEWEGDLRDPTFNAFGIRLLAPDPYWHPDSQDSAQLDVSTVIPGGHAFLAARLSGEWQGFGSASFPIRIIKVHPNGDVYAGGDFTNIGGVACRHIARWDGTAWQPLGAGALIPAPGSDIDNGTVTAIAFAPNGDVYIGGTFTTVGGAAMNRVTRYTPWNNITATGDDFHQLKVGANPGVASDVFALAVDRSGYCYIGGVFLATTDATTAYRIVRYNGPTLDTWTALSAASGLNAAVRCLEMDLDGSTVFIGGDFTYPNGLFTPSLPYICKWDGSAFSALAELGLNGSCRALRMALDGRLYLAGVFTVAGFWNVGKVAIWNRQEFYPLGGDTDGVIGGTVVNTIDIDGRGNVFFGGDFTGVTGDDACAYIAQWNGTRFGQLDLSPGAAVLAVASKFDKLFLGYNGASISSIADVQTVNNHGSASAYPILDVLGPVTLRWLENQETGKVIRFNLAVLAKERVLIDLRPGNLKAYSEWRGNVLFGLLPDSDFGDFSLLPGDNRISFHGTGGDGTQEVALRWRLADWSFDDVR